MKASTPTFRGMAPRLSPRLLPENGSQEAINARLLTGDLGPWKRPDLVEPLENAGVVRSIFLLDNVWLSWTEEVDAARGTILGDTTFRTFITGPEVYDEPRFTNYALATSGPAPYPFATRPLGVPGPDAAPTLDIGVDDTPTTFSVNVTDDGDQLTTSWSTSPTFNYGGRTAEVVQSDTIGNPPPSYNIQYDENAVGYPAYLYRNVGTGNATVCVVSFDFMCTDSAPIFFDPDRQACVTVQGSASGAGAHAKVSGTYLASELSIGLATAWGEAVAPLQSVPVPGNITYGTWYTMEVRKVTNPDGSSTVTATLYEGSAQICTLTVTNNFGTGDYLGFQARTYNDATGSFNQRFNTFHDNILVQASGSTDVQILNLATSYVYTFVNDLGQESAPSPASVTIQRPAGVVVTVTTPTVIPTGISDDFGIATKRIYRAATGALGSEFRFVAEIDLGVAAYVDALTDAELGEVLETTDWDLPPDDMRFILALPNGVMVGASGNQLCFSAQNRPHAWPVSYRLATDTEITGLGNVDTSVMIGTKSFVYTASGNDPANYSMSKPGAPHACASHRSIAYLLRIGVVFAGPDGLMAVNGPTEVTNLTESIFTREQWQALRPHTMIGRAHDDIYFFFHAGTEGGEEDGGYALDMKPNGFGLIKLGMYASAMATDFERDALILCLDEYEEPSSALLPLPPSSELPADGRTLYEWNASDDLMRYSWTGKLWLPPYPGAFQWVRVRAEDYDELQITFTADGVELMTRLVTSDQAFRIPVRSTYNVIDWTCLGTSTVRTVELADDVMELA